MDICNSFANSCSRASHEVASNVGTEAEASLSGTSFLPKPTKPGTMAGLRV